MIQTAVDLSPENPELLLWLGTILMRNKWYDEATEAFKKSVKLKPKSIHARAELARGYIQMGRTDEAIDVLKTVFEMDAETVEPGIMLALILLKRRRYDDVMRITEALIKRAPDNPTGFNLMASAQWAKGDEAAARRSLQQAITVDPNFLSAHRNLAQIDLKTGAVEAAKKRYRAMLEMPGASVRPLIDLAKIATQEGNLREAISLLSKARSEAPERIGVELDLIELLGRSGDGDAALRNARKLYEHYPDNPAVLEKLGHMEQAFGNLDEASRIFRRLAQSYSVCADQLLRISRFQLRAGDLLGAHGTLKRALVADDKHLVVLENIIGLESRLELYDDALFRTKLLIKQSPEKPLGYQLRGDVLTRLRKFDEAAAAYSKAIAKKPTGQLLVRRYIVERVAGKGAASLKAMEAWAAKISVRLPGASDNSVGLSRYGAEKEGGEIV